MTDAVEAQTTEESIQDEPKPVPGEKKMRFWSFLQSERVGQELLLSSEHIKQAAIKVDCSIDYVYQMLYKFEKEGLIRRKVEKDKGTTIIFLPKKDSQEEEEKKHSTDQKGFVGVKKFSGATTFAQAVTLLDEEISNLEDKLIAKKSLREQLLKMIEEEK